MRGNKSTFLIKLSHLKIWTHHVVFLLKTFTFENVSDGNVLKTITAQIDCNLCVHANHQNVFPVYMETENGRFQIFTLFAYRSIFGKCKRRSHVDEQSKCFVFPRNACRVKAV